jgi:protein tyrosine/serine phosphatase
MEGENMRIAYRGLLMVVTLFSLSGCYLNFHTVEEGNLYRSAQPTKEDFLGIIPELGIRTVINLRGYNPGAEWYDDEAAVTSSMGVQLVDIAMSAATLPHKADLIKLLDAFENAPRPIWIHCKSGADRTGEAAALYQIEHMGRPKDQALDMLSLYYGHIQVFKPAKIYFVQLYEGKQWAYDTYDPCVQDYQYYDKGFCTGNPPAPDEEANDT